MKLKTSIQEVREALKLYDRRAQITDWKFVSKYYNERDYKQSIIEDLTEIVNRRIPMKIEPSDKPVCPRCGMFLMSTKIKVCPSFDCLQELEE